MASTASRTALGTKYPPRSVNPTMAHAPSSTAVTALTVGRRAGGTTKATVATMAGGTTNSSVPGTRSTVRAIAAHQAATAAVAANGAARTRSLTTATDAIVITRLYGSR